MNQELIRAIPDHPKPGIVFRDITPLLGDAQEFRSCIQALARQAQGLMIDKIVGMEARGFIIGSALAFEMGAGFAPARKKGKLPAPVFSADYALEYGTDRIELHQDAIVPGERVLIVDDLLATGGTALAAAQLIEQCKGSIQACLFVIELPALGGRAKLEAKGHKTFSLCSF